jgi:hypothetical protein
MGRVEFPQEIRRQANYQVDGEFLAQSPASMLVLGRSPD